MTRRTLVWLWLVVLGTGASAWAQSSPAPASGARTVIYAPRDLVTLRTQVNFSTLIVLPDGEEVVDATCGDREGWLINVRGGLVSVKPATAGSRTNLNVVATSGQVYAFLLTEVSADDTQDVDLAVYLEPETLEGAMQRGIRPTWVRAEQLEDFRAQADLAREQARRATETAQADLERGLTEFRARYPLSLQFDYRVELDNKPFFVRAMFHDDHRTFIHADARELPALYELQDDVPSLVTFEVQDGTYIVPKVLEEGYLIIGSKRLGFRRLEAE